LRELLAGAEAKQRYDWDHTADTMALLATLHYQKTFSRDDFHPMRERVKSEPSNLDDPEAEYERLIKEGKGKKRKDASTDV
jgi:hypothetical protein